MKTEGIRWQSFWNLWYVAIGEHCLSLWNTEAQSVVALLGKGAGGGAQISLELPMIYNEYKQLWVVSCPLRLPGLSQHWSSLPSGIPPFWIGSSTSVACLQLFWKRTDASTSLQLGFPQIPHCTSFWSWELHGPPFFVEHSLQTLHCFVKAREF